MRKIYKSIMNTLDQEAPEYIYKYGTWDDILFRKLITEQVAYFASPQIYREEADIKHKIDRSILEEDNRLQFYSNHYKKLCPLCSEDEITRMAKNALKNNIITEDKLLEVEQRWQKIYNELIGVFCTGLTPYEKILWRDFGGKAKEMNIISGICIKIDREQAFPEVFGTGKKTNYGSPILFNPLLIYQSDTEAEKYASEFLFTLPADFCDENEYRIVRLLKNNKDREIPIPKESIKQIILNPKMGKEKMQEIKKCIQFILPDTEIKQLKRSNQTYKLVTI